MSEWQGMQKQPNTKLEDLLTRTKSKIRNLSELSKSEQNRLAKLNAMLDELRLGENVQNRRLATWLSEDEYESFESDREGQQRIGEELSGKPDKLKRYENKLHHATFNGNKAGRFRKRGNKDKFTKFRNLSERYCKEALEILQEIVDADASLHMWFGRGLDFGHGSLVDAQLGNLPHVATSRSLDRQTTDNRLLSKRKVKIAIMEWAISALLTVEPVDKKQRKEQESAKLSEFLQLINLVNLDIRLVLPFRKIFQNVYFQRDCIGKQVK